MPMLVAKVPFPYGGRNLIPGMEFDAADGFARILVGLSKADYVRADAQYAVQEQSEEVSAANEVASLRALAHANGLKIDGRWSIARLRDEVAQASARYQRRDMRAQD